MITTSARTSAKSTPGKTVTPNVSLSIIALVKVICLVTCDKNINSVSPYGAKVGIFTEPNLQKHAR